MEAGRVAGQRCVLSLLSVSLSSLLQSLSPWSSCARWTTGSFHSLCLLSPCISFSAFLQNRAALLHPVQPSLFPVQSRSSFAAATPSALSNPLPTPPHTNF
ncbi:hypothetical protein GY45DRAFT_671881 [Cubamyces sp. BRFM 1775]|nr:hypothetical protein GY45DRAFT_671881 [Cubamyces sp. BRFM 1775]